MNGVKGDFESPLTFRVFHEHPNGTAVLVAEGSSSEREEGGGGEGNDGVLEACPHVASVEWTRMVQVEAHLARVVAARKESLASGSTRSSLIVGGGDEHCLGRRTDRSAFTLDPQDGIPFAHMYFDALDERPGDQWTGIPTSLYLPLGARFEVPHMPRQQVAAVAHRQYTWFFAGSLSTARDVRVRFAQLAEEHAARAPDLYQLYAAKMWVSNPSARSGHVAPERFAQLMGDSVFALLPSGQNEETFRLYEALEYGAIPVRVANESQSRHGVPVCEDPLRPLTTQGLPSITLASWEELPLLDTARERGVVPETGETLESLQSRCLDFYEAFMGESLLSLFVRAYRRVKADEMERGKERGVGNLRVD
jgi:hypothetical protein